MAHIPFAMEAANGYQYISVGTFAASVSGGAGVVSSHIWLLWSILFHGTMILLRPGMTSLTLTGHLPQNVLCVEGHAIVPKGQVTWTGPM